jgi:hypothetical protein
VSAETIALVCYCPRCDYFVATAVQPGAVGTHGCMQCDELMQVYIAQGSREVVQWHDQAAREARVAARTKEDADADFA